MDARKQFNELSSACPDNKFPNAALFIKVSIRVERRETFVIVLMSVQHYVDMRSVHETPKRIEVSVVAVPTRTETRVMKICQRAHALMLVEILLKPFLLLYCQRGSKNIAIQRHQMPIASVETVETGLVRTSGWSPICKVWSRPSRVVFVITWRRPGPVSEATPGRFVALLIFGFGAVRIGQVAKRQHSA